jgi:hypothetical protein
MGSFSFCSRSVLYQRSKLRVILGGAQFLSVTAGAVNVTVNASAEPSQTRCGTEVVTVPTRGRIDVVTRSLLVLVSGNQPSGVWSWSSYCFTDMVFCCFNSLKELKGQTPRVGYCVQRVCLHSIIPQYNFLLQPNISLALNADTFFPVCRKRSFWRRDSDISKKCGSRICQMLSFSPW